MGNYKLNKKQELIRERQKLSIRLFIIVYIISLIGSAIGIFHNQLIAQNEMIFQLVIALCIYITSFVLLFIASKIKNKLFMIDLLLFMVAILTYFAVIFLSPNAKIVMVFIWMPFFIVSMFLIMRKIIVYSFLIIHFIITIGMFVMYPNYEYTVNNNTYIFAITVTILVGLSMFFILKLLEKYQNTILNDNRELEKNNIELKALNEKFCSSQEELIENNNKIRTLNIKTTEINENLSHILQLSDKYIIDYDVKAKEYSNADKFCELMGFDSSDELIEKIINRVINLEQNILKNAWTQLLNKEITYFENDFKVTSPSEQYLRLTLTRFLSDVTGKEKIVLTVKDITELIRQEEELFRYAFFDEKTSLFNRAGFSQNIEKYSQNINAPYSVVFIDIIRFKDINNTYGYEAGDEILAFLGNTLMSAKENLIVSRIGPDVFGIIHLGYLKTKEEIEKFELNFSRIKYRDEVEIKLYYNIGLYNIEECNLSSNEIMKRADMALLKAKESYDSTYCIYGNEVGSEVSYRAKMSYALEQAVQNKSLYMVFQPIYNSIGDQVYGFESLVWWEDRELGFVPPDIFIGVAEKSNLIHRLSDVIQNKIWDFTGKINEVNKGLYISINISGKELSRPDFAERFIENARQKYIEPSNIGIEVTESSMINNLELAEKQLLRLKQEGFQIYLDDFGTGYSSLSYLYKLPIDVLKIDKSFIDQIITEKNKEYLLRGIIQLARQLSIETLAEGVETEKQVEILKNIGVDYIQGYYYSKPLSFDDALKLLQ